MLRDLLADMRTAVSSLRREPGFVLLAVVTLGVGVGATATVFGMVDQLLLRPVPGVADPSRAASVGLQGYSRLRAGGPSSPPWLSIRDFDQLQGATDLLAGMGAFGRNSMQVSTGSGPATRVLVNEVYGDYFGVLGVRPVEGHLLHADESLGDPRIVVLSEELSAKLFGDVKTVVGRTIYVDGQSVTVVGVAGGGFQGTERRAPAQMWLPFSALTVFDGFSPEDVRSRASVDIVVRLPRGVDPKRAEAQMRSALEGIVQADPGEAPRLAHVRPVLRTGLPYPDWWVAQVYEELGPFGVVVGLVLLIGCANVATLLLMRNATRRGAVATRRALGASPGRIVRYHLTESTLLAGLGSAAGLLVAWLIAIPFAGQSVAPGMPAFADFHMDAQVLVFALAASAVTLVAFGAGPAMLAGRFDLAGALRAADSSVTQGMAGLRRLMSAGQIALSITLLTGASLLVRTVRNLDAIDTGISIDQVATVDLGMPTNLGAPSALPDVYRDVVAAVRSVPGVEGAAMDMGGPLARGKGVDLAVAGAPGRGTWAVIRPVTAGWFDVVRLPMVRGAPFRDGDWRPGSAPVPIVVTSALAQRVFGSTNVVGRTLFARLSPEGMREARIVGVSRDLRLPDQPDRPLDAFFAPLSSFPFLPVTLVVRAHSLDQQMGRGIRQAVHRVLPNVEAVGLIPVTAELRSAFAEQKTLGRLLELLSTLAVILASVGLYSVIAFSVAQRRREFGIRVALGAEDGRIARLVLGDAAAIVVVGTGMGLFGAYMLSILLANRLYGVAQVDPISYVAAAVLCALVAAAACWMPARAAMRADPMETLRDA